MTTRRYHALHGLSLIELMVAMAVGSILLLGVLKVFDLHQRGFQLIVDLHDREDNAQRALSLLSDAIQMAGHWGGLAPDSLHLAGGQLAAAPGGCDQHWVFDFSHALQGFDGASAARQIQGLPLQCIKNPDYRASSDVLAVRFADSRQYFTDQEIDNKRYARHYFVRSQAGQSGMVFQGQYAQTAVKHLPDQGYHYNMAYASFLFFLKPCELNSQLCTAEDTVLTRLKLSANRYIQEPLVEGIEHLQFEYGVDENADSEVERYLPAADVRDWQSVKSVRIYLLARGHLKDLSQDDLGTVYLMNSAASPQSAHYKVPESGRYYRHKLYQRDVQLRNRSG